MAAGSRPTHAPVVEDAVLAGEGLQRPEAVPEVGVSGDEPEGHFLAAADQDRHRAAMHRRILRPAPRDDGEPPLQVPQAVTGRAEQVAVRGVVALGPPGTEAEEQAPPWRGRASSPSARGAPG